MRPVIWIGLVAFACGSQTTPTPSGAVVATFDAKTSSWAALAAAAPNATNIRDGSFDAASKDGASVRIRYKTGVIALDGTPTKAPLEASVTVTDSQGFWISGALTGPMHFAGMPADTRALDFRGQVSRGTRSCAGTSYTNDQLHVRIHGDGTAVLLAAPAPGGSVAPAASR